MNWGYFWLFIGSMAAGSFAFLVGYLGARIDGTREDTA